MDREAAGEDSPPLSTSILSETEDAISTHRGMSLPGDLEAAEAEGAALTTEGYFSLRQCDSASLSSFSMDTPSLPRKLIAQDDTDSLVSTGTLVPEAIYLPPAGHRLVTHSDWDALNAQASSLLSRHCEILNKSFYVYSKFLDEYVCGVMSVMFRCLNCEGRSVVWRRKRRSWRKNWIRRPTTRTNR